jgi:hypothetical protein
MDPNDVIEVTIRNHRYTRWSTVASVSVSATFILSACCLLGLQAWLSLFGLIAIGASVAFAGAMGLGRFSPYTLQCLNLSDELQPWPGGVGYLPVDIERIDFASDPAEDYDESPSTIRMCEARVRPVHRLAIRLIASVDDGRRLRDWAVRKGIDVYDPTNVLCETPVPAE